MLPNFVGLGPSRSGTTSIHAVLDQHPDVYVPKQKEADFFSTPLYEFGVGYYERLFFSEYAGQSALGEISPSYLHSKEAVDRIYDGLGPGVKLLVFLRNPVDRALSEYRFYLKGLAQTRPFIDYLASDPRPADANNPLVHSLYADSIARYVARFGRESIFPIIFEQDIRSGQPELLRRLCRFLEIPNRPQSIPSHSNPTPKVQATYFDRATTVKTPGLADQSIQLRADTLVVLNDQLPGWNFSLYRPSPQALAAAELLNDHRSFKLTAEMRSELMVRYFETDIKRTEDLLQIDLSHWRQPARAEAVSERPQKDLFRRKKNKLAKKLRKFIGLAFKQ
jgi:hypothetical protein